MRKWGIEWESKSFELTWVCILWEKFSNGNIWENIEWEKPDLKEISTKKGTLTNLSCLLEISF